jgi:hypothetical protein
MQSNLAFASGIQELSVDEIGFVSGGFNDSLEAPDKKDTKSLGIWKGACKLPVIKIGCALVEVVGFLGTVNEIIKAGSKSSEDGKDKNGAPKKDNEKE